MDNEKKITGFVWMTSIIRSNLYCFRSFINEYLCKEKNIHLWPYIGPVVMNELKKIYVICESFVLEERNTAYYFLLESIF